MVQICNVASLQKWLDTMNPHSHIICIANRLSNRGMNYTNSNYTRFITHQLIGIKAGTNFTGFLQKCRIFGNRPENSTHKPILYCLVKGIMQGAKMINGLIREIDNVVHNIRMFSQGILNLSYFTLTSLRLMCLKRGIKGVWKMKKNEMVQTLLHIRWKRLFPMLAHNRSESPFFMIPMDVIRVICNYL